MTDHEHAVDQALMAVMWAPGGARAAEASLPVQLQAARARRGRDQDHVREHVHEGSLARRGLAARGDRGLRQAGHGGEVPDQRK
jgi:hypothetical protein